MLTGLSIRDFILVRQLDLELGQGFTALTGETGAGKSILMSALGFALGGRGGQALIRPGAQAAEVTAAFEVPTKHSVRDLLAAMELEPDAAEPLVLRRVIKRGGGARAFLNDRPVSAALLSDVGLLLADIHGQHDGLGLLEPARHRALLDAWAKAEPVLKQVATAWSVLREAEEARAALAERIARAASERTWLAHAVDELDALDPQEGETGRLALERAGMLAGGRVAEALDAARKQFTKSNIENALATAARAVSRALSAPGLTGEGADSELAVRIRAACEGLERALIEAGEARRAVELAGDACAYSPAALEASEARLFALRAAARKHEVDPEGLAALRQKMRAQLDEIDHSDKALAKAVAAEKLARAAYDETAGRLTELRTVAAKKLAKAVSAELAPLKLEKAKFRIAVKPRAEAGPTGKDDVAFEVETNAGAGFGALDRIASGGELARFALAVSVCLADVSPAGTLVFDEADMGVGGAVAAAIGERLAIIGKRKQVLAITHSPQVAASAAKQLRVSKAEAGGETVTSVDTLTQKARREEIARMLAGASVTKEARAAADRLLAGA
jgi:DNA repair protein RecN (Recombination protein N)